MPCIWRLSPSPSVSLLSLSLSLSPSSPCMPTVILSPGSGVGVGGSVESTLAASEIRVNLEDNTLQKIQVQRYLHN